MVSNISRTGSQNGGGEKKMGRGQKRNGTWGLLTVKFKKHVGKKMFVCCEGNGVWFVGMVWEGTGVS